MRRGADNSCHFGKPAIPNLERRSGLFLQKAATQTNHSGDAIPTLPLSLGMLNLSS